MVEAVASVNNNTVVVINAVGPVIVDAWIENANVTGLVRLSLTFVVMEVDSLPQIWSGLPGQEAGKGHLANTCMNGDINRA